MVKVAIVILNWNGKKYLERFLPGLIERSLSDGVEIWVADNASGDDSVAYIENNFSSVKLIKFDINHGFAKGYKLALNQIQAEYYVLLNSDVDVTSNWLEPLIKMMDHDKSIGACMPKIRAYNNKEYFEYAGAAGGFIDKYGYPFCRGRILDTIEKDNNQYDNIIEIFWASGACMFVRSEAYNKVDGLDEDFFAHMEEIDLCWRMKNAGYKIMVCPESVVYHIGGGTLPNDNPFKLYLNFRNNLYLLYKNLPENKFYRILLTRMILDGIAGIVFILKFKFSSIHSIIKAHIHFYKNLKSLRLKRHQLIHKNGSVDNLPGTFHKSIVTQYFIRKKITFSHLKIRTEDL
jgi:GT2 family glycosyltransferase